MYWVGVLFSYWGRIGRRTFWGASAGLFGFLLVYQYLTGGLILELMGWALWSYVQSALLVKRLHDVGWTGLWAIAPGGGLFAGGLALSFANSSEGTTSALRMVVFSIPMACAIGFILGFMAWIGTKPGLTYVTRYGEPPDDQDLFD